MDKTGTIPKRLSKYKIPLCLAYFYTKATKVPLRNKPSTTYKPKEAKVPGENVSVDQLVSPTLGLVAQITGKLTHKRYKYATVFVDQASKMGYVYMQKTATCEETIEAKKAFEQHSLDHGVKIKAYHADNGIFRANEWQKSCRDSKQALTFTGVNSHHTNGHAEKRIRDLQDLTRTSLIHSSSKWPGCITANLWPYALRLANDALNNSPIPQDKERHSPPQVFLTN